MFSCIQQFPRNQLSQATQVVQALPASLCRHVIRPKTHAPSQLFSGSRPLRLHKRIRPLRLLNALAFNEHLRARAKFSEALQEARTYESSAVDDVFLEPLRDSSGDPGKASIGRACARLDVVSMLVMRRKFNQARRDGTLLGINMYSDASPVTGRGLGCSGRVCKCILPRV